MILKLNQDNGILKKKIISIGIILFGILLILLYWIIEIIVEIYIFKLDEGYIKEQDVDGINIYNQFLRYRIWMRLSVVIPILIFSIYIQKVINNRRKANLIVKKSEEKFRNLFKKTPNSIILFNKDGIIIDLNSAAENLFELKKDDLIGENYNKLSLYSSELSTILKENLVFKEENKESNPLEIELQKKNADQIWVNLKTSSYEIENEFFIQTIIEDITEKKKAEKIIKDEIKKLKELDEIKTDLIRRTSHEFKTPLNSIFSTSQYLLNNYRDQIDGNILKLIEIINSGGQRLTKLTNNLLDSFYLEDSGLKVEKRKENIIELTKECAKDLTIPLRDKEIFLKLELNGDFYLNIDKNRIAQVLLNLLSNAIKNTPPKGIIYINVQPQESYIDIIIKDTGVGFTEEEKEKIFKKFGKIERKDVDKNIDTEGSGLGLFISKKIIELHDGKIWVESMGRNRGSSFIVRLPINNSNLN